LLHRVSLREDGQFAELQVERHSEEGPLIRAAVAASFEVQASHAAC
jgi:hypothetical protein